MMKPKIQPVRKIVIPAHASAGVNSSGNPAHKHWIPGQARNDKYRKEISESLH
jgi:hypothetical protein